MQKARQNQTRPQARGKGGMNVSVKQVSVFLENKPRRLAAATGCLSKAGVNIRALSVADTTDFGILRIIADDPELAFRALDEGGFTVSMTDVVAVEVPDKPGGLFSVLDIMAQEDVNLEYIYAFVGRSGEQAINVFRVDEVARTHEILKRHGIKVLEGEDVYHI